MANTTNLQDLVKYIVNGTLEEIFCQICLMPLGENYQSISSRIHAEDKTYCVAEVLAQICDIKVPDEVEYKICCNCVKAATQAYKFYLTAQKSHKIMDFYVNEINNQLDSIVLDDLTFNLCIILPIYLSNDGSNDLNQSLKKSETSVIYNLTETNNVKQNKAAGTESDDDLIIVLNENGERQFYKTQKDGTFALVENEDEHIKCYLNLLEPGVKLNPDAGVKANQSLDSNVKSSSSPDSSVKKSRVRKRNLMEYKKCSQCPIQYRFVRKLKEHMKEEHSIDLFVCQVCQALVEGDKEFAAHVQTHTGIHMCSVCNMVFKKRETIVSHIKWHEQMRTMEQSDAAHVCEMCGLIFGDGEELKEHHDKTHVKKFTCYYCGRMYKGELSFNMHIKKHEMNTKQDQDNSKLETVKRRKRKFKCGTCEKDFVDERALLWHERLHTNERPYACDVCGRGFVSLNRRNQHAVCAHTAPARRCPLCPALFHLRSMVNSHIKKVHLKAHKRPNRTSRYQNVFWKTEPVPIQELSVSIQNDILELQAQRSRQGTESMRGFTRPGISNAR